MSKEIPGQKIDKCSDCPHRYLPEYEHGCAINYQHGGDGIYQPECPLKDWQEPQPVQWLDKPNEEADYWFYRSLDLKIKCGFVSFSDNNFVVSHSTGCAIYKLYELQGKWHKAELPIG